MFALKPWTKRMLAPLPRAETPFDWIPDEFATLFNRFFTTGPVIETPEWPYRWGMTTEEKEKEMVIRYEMPGFAPEEVKVELLGDRLVVEAEHKEKEPAEKEKVEEKAERYAHVKRVIALPAEIDVEKLEAVLKNGVLEIRIPRKPEAVARRIEVKA